MQTKLEELAEQIQAQYDHAQAIVAKAESEGRTLTKDEQRTVGDKIAEADTLEKAYKAARVEAGLVEKIRNGIGRIDDGPGTKGGFGPSWGSDVVKAMRSAGMKALVTGSITVPSLSLAVARDPQRPRSLFDVYPRTTLRETDTFSYLRETARTNAAAPVAAGDTKPTSVFTVQKIEDTVSTIATLTEAIDNQTLSDAPLLQRYLDDVLREAVELTIESQTVSGNGTGANLTGMLNTAGRQTQAWATDVLTTLRKALTQLQADNFRGGTFALNPADWEAVDLARLESYGAGGGDSPVDTATQRLWGQPVVVTAAVPAGVGVLFDRESVHLYVRDQIRIDADASGELFETNRTKLRAEARVGFAVLRPLGIVEVDLTAA